MIGDRHLALAAEGHLERTALHGPKPIHRILMDLGVEHPEELLEMARAIRTLRDPNNEDAYSGGFMDGFILGVRAEREAAARIIR